MSCGFYLHTMDMICFLLKKKKKVWAWPIFEEVEERRRKGRELRKKV